MTATTISSVRCLDEVMLSVIVPMFNVEEYIGECIRSLVRQTLGASHMEILIVDDCSTDGSLVIAQEYENRYPDVVRVIKRKANGGLGAARNSGVAAARGNFIAFIDSDDFIDDDAFEYVIGRMLETSSDIGLYQYRYYSESRTDYPRNPSASMFAKNRAIERWEYATYPELLHGFSACNKVFAREIVEKCDPFPEGRLYEDMVFSTQSFLATNSVYVTDAVTYHYRKRESANQESIMDTHGRSRKSLFDHLVQSEHMSTLLGAHPELRFARDWLNLRMLTSLVLPLVSSERDVVNLSLEDRRELWVRFRALLAPTDPLNSFQGVGKAARKVTATLRAYATYDDFIAAAPPPSSGKSLSSAVRGVRRKMSRRIRSQAKKGRKPARALLQARDISRLRKDIAAAEPLARGVRERHPEGVWLFTERGHDARDNAFALFSYVRTHHPEIPAYFLLDQRATNEDRARVAALGPIVEYGSPAHLAYFLAARVVLSTHNRSLALPARPEHLRKVLGERYDRVAYVFLGHGITYSDLALPLGKHNPKAAFDLFICGARPEFETVSTTYGYNPGEVVYTGLPRFDKFHDAPPPHPRRIALMPTWRKGIVQPSWVRRLIVKDITFLKSRYYTTYMHLLNSPVLADVLERHDAELVVLLHPEVQRYAHFFTTMRPDLIRILDNSAASPGDLLLNAQGLVTDYSSVFMDFAYQGKPTIAYQFDQEQFRGKHYEASKAFIWEYDGFGATATQEDQLISSIDRMLGNDFAMSSPYRERAEAFFEIRDAENSKRVLEEVTRLLDRRGPLTL